MHPPIADFLASTAIQEVTDAEEAQQNGCPAEAFLLFTQAIPTTNLGFVDSRASSLDVTISGNEYTVHQSPTLLSSSRAGGTTGAVLWKITPRFAEWISSPANPLWTHSLLSPSSVVAELGCGISALVALALAPSVRHYLATDQEYVRRVFRTNLEANASVKAAGSASSKQKSSKTRGSSRSTSKSKQPSKTAASNITFTTLDWELDQPELLKDCIESESSSPTGHDKVGEDEDRGFDLLLSCDCIYNEALVAPFVRTCAEICRLRPAYEPSSQEASRSSRQPTICIVAQQQRAPEVFETWLRETLREFRVWRLSDEVLGDGLKGGTGYLVHLLLARESS
ncbi:Diaminohydroxyphosphoribosylamino-pyrimidine deaminase [Penicillium rolfsii]|nr:Diaminohydroxyphosphoribosylamino-pyrimidine deaminase [Penicillium rolfsii]